MAKNLLQPEQFMYHVTSLCHIHLPTILIGTSKVITPFPSIHYGMTFEMTH
jgi:hypothetical protein